MSFNCCVADCNFNYDTASEKTTTFSFRDEVKEPDRLSRGLKFVNRMLLLPTANDKICERHFQPVYIKQANGPNGRSRLIKASKPVPTILDLDVQVSPVISHMKAFMIVGMKENVPYVIKASPDTAITGEWLQKEIED